MTPTRYTPPGCASSSAVSPIQRTALSGSTRNSHTVSRVAAIASSRSTVVSVVVSMLGLLLSLCLALDRLEPGVPKRFEELSQLREALGARPVQAPGTVSPLAHEPRLLQDGQMLGDRRSADVEVGRNRARGQLVVTDETENRAAPGRGDRLQSGFHAAECKRSLTLGQAYAYATRRQPGRRRSLGGRRRPGAPQAPDYAMRT